MATTRLVQLRFEEVLEEISTLRSLLSTTGALQTAHHSRPKRNAKRRRSRIRKKASHEKTVPVSEIPVLAKLEALHEKVNSIDCQAKQANSLHLETLKELKQNVSSMRKDIEQATQESLESMNSKLTPILLQVQENSKEIMGNVNYAVLALKSQNMPPQIVPKLDLQAVETRLAMFMSNQISEAKDSIVTAIGQRQDSMTITVGSDLKQFIENFSEKIDTFDGSVDLLTRKLNDLTDVIKGTQTGHMSSVSQQPAATVVSKEYLDEKLQHFEKVLVKEVSSVVSRRGSVLEYKLQNHFNKFTQEISTNHEKFVQQFKELSQVITGKAGKDVAVQVYPAGTLPFPEQVKWQQDKMKRDIQEENSVKACQFDNGHSILDKLCALQSELTLHREITAAILNGVNERLYRQEKILQHLSSNIGVSIQIADTDESKTDVEKE